MVVSGPERLSLLMTRRPGHRFAAALLRLRRARRRRLRAPSRASAPRLRSQTPEQFIGFRVGTDRKLARWDTIVAYMQHAAAGSDRVRLRELGRTSRGEPFLALEISAPETHPQPRSLQAAPAPAVLPGRSAVARASATRFPPGQGRAARHLQRARHRDRRHADGARARPPARDRRFAGHRKILDNVMVLLVPSANPDGQIRRDRLVQPEPSGRRSKAARCPTSIIPTSATTAIATCTCSRRRRASTWRSSRGMTGSPRVARSAPDGQPGPRMFVMPATDPINPNVHPLIYRWNAILGQSQAAALEVAGKRGHHLQLDLHELLAGRARVDRLVAQPDWLPHRGGERPRGGAGRSASRD